MIQYKDGHSLQYASEELRGDKLVITEVVKQNLLQTVKFILNLGKSISQDAMPQPGADIASSSYYVVN